MTRLIFLVCLLTAGAALGAERPVWEQAAHDGDFARECLMRCRDYLRGWLAHADPATGLIPRNLHQSRDYWNGRDAAADNYSFMVLTSALVDRALLEGRMLDMLRTETRLTSRLDNLVADYSFSRQGFRRDESTLADMTFDSSEYVKDGLMPVTEWLGPSPWSERMTGLVDSLLDHAAVQTPVGVLPAADHEVGGELMQILSRLYWMTGEERYRQTAFLYADFFLLHELPTRRSRLSLDDHGCEVIGGLSEVYYLAARTDEERHARYRAPVHEMLDRILEVGRNDNGLFHMEIDPVAGRVLNEELTDNWGYDYDAFLTVAEVDDHEPYREAVRFALENVHEHTGYPWENNGADGFADSIESGLNLLNRIPVPSGFVWVEHETRHMLEKQRDDGIIEGWHGDGNYARTALMVALWKSRGCQIQPWRADVSLGAAERDGALHVSVRSRWPWEGRIVFDRPRHAEFFGIPTDYARLNQFPEWFTVEKAATYTVTALGGEDETTQTLAGSALRNGLPVTLGENDTLRLIVRP